jgi:hypothetical protein
MEFEEVAKILEDYSVRLAAQCKGNPTNCNCERCLKIKGEW